MSDHAFCRTPALLILLYLYLRQVPSLLQPADMIEQSPDSQDMYQEVRVPFVVERPFSSLVLGLSVEGSSGI